MSRFTEIAATAQTLSLAAMEEASRLGERTADIDHLLLALTVNEQTAGQVLRAAGVTLPVAREAVDAQHAQQLAALGISASAPGPGQIVFHETGGYEWSVRAREIITRASKGGRRGDAAAVLRELLDEPSGTIDGVLERIGVFPAEVRARLDEAERLPADRPTRPADRLSGTADAFVPAPPDRVWDLLRDPASMPVWEPAVGDAPDAPADPAAGTTWVVHARTERPDGTAIRVKPAFRTQQVELVAREEGRLLEWRFRFPDAAAANARRVRIELEPAAGGTHLRLALAWERGIRRRTLLGLVLRPLYRWAIWMQLSHLGAAVSRAFR